MFIQTEATPNPTTRRLMPGQTLHDGPAVDVPTAEDAQRLSPLAAALFGHPQVRGVMIGQDWLSVTLADPIDWEEIGPNVLLTVANHLQSGQPVITETAAAEPTTASWTAADEAERDLLTRVDALLATRVRPALAQDGGDAVLMGMVEGGGVRIALKGACVGCPSSTLTLKMGIENLLRHYFPGEVGWVEAA